MSDKRVVHVMLDVETMGVRPDAAIIQIGAVHFDAHGQYSQFARTVSLESSADHGGVIDASTVAWWMEQRDAARQAVLDDQHDICDALAQLSTWFETLLKDDPTARLRVWGNGPAFDNAIVRSAYARLGMLAPWHWSADRCFRTMREMAPNVPEPVRVGFAHHALHDAMHQAAWATAILAQLQERGA